MPKVPDLVRRTWPLWPLLILLMLLLVLPVGQLLTVSILNRQGEFTGVHYASLMRSTTYLRILANTFELAGWTTLICIILGYPVSYLLANSSGRSRSWLALFVLLPFWTSFLVRTFAWIIMLGRKGVVNSGLSAFGVSDPAPLIYNYTGVLIGMSHALLPIAILTMSSVMEGIPKDLTKAAGTLGARRSQAFLRIYMPLSMPGVASAALMVFISALGFFITPALLGGPRETMITQVIIDSVQTLLNWGLAAAIATLLLAATIVVYVLYDRLVGISTLSGSEASRKPRRVDGVLSGLSRRLGKALIAKLGIVLNAWDDLFSRKSRLKKRRSPSVLTIVGMLVVAFLVLPSLVVVPISFTESNFLEWPPQGFTLKWYQAYLESPLWLSASWRSLTVGLASAALATLIGAPAAFILAKRRFPLRGAVFALILAPMILPRMIIALALFYLYAQIGLVGSSFGLVLSHVVLAVPYVVVTMIAVLKSHDERLEQAAGTLGAKPWHAVRRITIPLIRPGLISAFLFAFVTSFDELTVALFVTGGLSATLPKQMWDDALLKVSPILAAVSTVILVAVTVVVFIGEFFRRQSVQRTIGER
jgi:putative spermidine/putrescine transport system permease protein